MSVPPCLNCGKSPIIETDFSDFEYIVRCPDCGAMLGRGEDMKAALKAWTEAVEAKRKTP